MDVASKAPGWLNRNTIAMAATSFFSDLGHETVTVVLPGFFAALGAPPYALGVTEGLADGVSSFAKLGSGWFGDRFGHRKAVATAGYFMTSAPLAAIAAAGSWGAVVPGRVAGWFGRGTRGPLRDAMLAESVSPESTGRAFGLEQTGDALGAILGPLLAILLLGAGMAYRGIIALSVIPGIFATLTFGMLVRDPRTQVVSAGRVFSSFGRLPSRFRLFLIAVAIFGIGDFSHTLLILRASNLLSPDHGTVRAAQLAVALFIVHNVIYAASALPIGALSDRIGRRKLLLAAYLVAAIAAIGFLSNSTSLLYLGGLFLLSGLYMAGQNTLERAVAADLLPGDTRATGFGVLAAVNGFGDLISSVIVGTLWTVVGYQAGFIYAAAMAFAGSLLLLLVSLADHRNQRVSAAAP